MPPLLLSNVMHHRRTGNTSVPAHKVKTKRWREGKKGKKGEDGAGLDGGED